MNPFLVAPKEIIWSWPLVARKESAARAGVVIVRSKVKAAARLMVAGLFIFGFLSFLGFAAVGHLFAFAAL